MDIYSPEIKCKIFVVNYCIILSLFIFCYVTFIYMVIGLTWFERKKKYVTVVNFKQIWCWKIKPN